MKKVIDERLLDILKGWRAIVVSQDIWMTEDQVALDRIVARLKNQPTITKKDIENCAGAIQYSVQTHEDWGYVEDIIKEMLENIGVSILPAKSGERRVK